MKLDAGSDSTHADQEGNNIAPQIDDVLIEPVQPPAQQIISKREAIRVNSDALQGAFLAHIRETLGDFCTPEKLEKAQDLTKAERRFLTRISHTDEPFDLDQATGEIVAGLIKKIRRIGLEDGLDYAFRDAHTLQHGNLLTPETLIASSTADLSDFAEAFFATKDIWGAKSCLEEIAGRTDLDDLTFVRANLRLADCSKVMSDTETATEIYDSMDAYIYFLTDQKLEDLLTKLPKSLKKQLIENLSESENFEFPARLRSHLLTSTLPPEDKIELLRLLNKQYRAKGKIEDAISSAREINDIAKDPANAGKVIDGNRFHAQHRVYKLQDFPIADRAEHIRFYEVALKTMNLSEKIIFTAHSRLATLYENDRRYYDALGHLLAMQGRCRIENVNDETVRRIDRIREKIKKKQSKYLKNNRARTE